MSETGKITEQMSEERETAGNSPDFSFFEEKKQEVANRSRALEKTLAGIREPDISSPPEEIENFWKTTAGNMKKMEEEKKWLLGEQGNLENISKEFGHPEKGMPAAKDYLDKLLAKYPRKPDEIAGELVEILRRDEDLENEEKNLEAYVKKQQEEAKIKRESSPLLAEYHAIADVPGKTDAEKVEEIKKWLTDKRMNNEEKRQFRLILEQWSNIRKRIDTANKRIEAIEEEKTDNFMKKVELEREHRELGRLLEAKAALEKRIAGAT
jgi:hypothetical protein